MQMHSPNQWLPNLAAHWDQLEWGWGDFKNHRCQAPTLRHSDLIDLRYNRNIRDSNNSSRRSWCAAKFGRHSKILMDMALKMNEIKWKPWGDLVRTYCPRPRSWVWWARSRLPVEPELLSSKAISSIVKLCLLTQQIIFWRLLCV